MKLVTTLFLASALVMSGCGYKAEDDTTTAPTPQNTSQSSLPAAFPSLAGDTTIKANPATNVNPVTGATAAGAVTSGGAGINPAHGQPGHRCDIAVGAPLNSKPVSPPPSTGAAQNTVATSAPVPTAQPVATGAKTAAGINPAHGQPGHRCDIAVGSPLDSKPVSSTTTSAPATGSTPVIGSSPVLGSSPVNATPSKTGVSPLAVTPIQPAGIKPAATTGAGLNPAHGQPGHRCDIAVGAPLTSKSVVPAPTVPKQQ